MDEDTELKLLAGMPLEIDNFEIRPLTLREIVKIGYTKYNTYLINLIAEPVDFNLVKDVDISKITTWDILLSNMYYGTDEHSEFLLGCFKTFLCNKVNFENNCFITENIKIRQDNFEKFKEILKLQNCFKKEKEKKFANAKAKEIQEKILKGRRMLDKIQGKSITFKDLISSLAANDKCDLNILNVWDLTFYQFNDQFARMQMIEDYDISIRSLLAGAKKEDVELKYYVRQMENN